MAASLNRNFWLSRMCSPVLRNACRNVSRSSSDSLSYCVNLVRKADYENFLCTLLLPEHVRSSVFAIKAFNVELAQVQDIVSEKQIGLMRMRFWKDAVQQIFQGESPQTPVALELAKAIRKQKLSKRWLTRIIERREQQLLADAPYLDLEELEDHGEKTMSSVHYLTLQALGVENVNADHAASHLGKAQAVTTVLRAVPYHGNRSRVYLPTDVMIKNNVSHEDIIRGRREQRVTDVMYDIASRGYQHLQKARSLSAEIPTNVKVALLPCVAVDNYLTKLQKLDFDVFHPSLQQRNHMLAWNLWTHKIKRKY